MIEILFYLLIGFITGIIGTISFIKQNQENIFTAIKDNINQSPQILQKKQEYTTTEINNLKLENEIKELFKENRSHILNAKITEVKIKEILETIKVEEDCVIVEFKKGKFLIYKSIDK